MRAIDRRRGCLVLVDVQETEMKLNRESRVARFYYATYRHLPTDLCRFWWKLLGAIALLPLTWWTYFTRDSKRGYMDLDERCGIGVAVWMAIAALTGLVVVFLWNWIALLVILGVLLIIAALLSLPEWGDCVFDSTPVTVARERYKAFKEGYCPRIEWIKKSD